MADKKDEPKPKLHELLDQKIETEQTRDRESTFLDMAVQGDFFRDYLKGDIKNLDTMKPEDLTKAQLDLYKKHHTAHVKKRHGVDLAHFDGAAEHVKQKLYDTVLGTNMVEANRYFIREGSNSDAQQVIAIHQQAKTEGIEALIGNEVTKATDDDLKGLADKYIASGLKKGEKFNYALFTANRAQAADSIARVKTGRNTAEQIVRQYADRSAYKK